MTTDWAEHRRALDEWSAALDYSGRMTPYAIGALVVAIAVSLPVSFMTHTLWGMIAYLPWAIVMYTWMTRSHAANLKRKAYERL